MKFKKDYILGFAFDQFGAVALIEKKRPAWQAGKWNGIGGHREDGETGHQGISREFHEETSMLIPPAAWRHVGGIHKGTDYRCLVYTVTVDLLQVHSATDERVKVFVPGEEAIYPLIGNVGALIALCRIKPDAEGTIPLFELDYTARRLK